MTHPLRSYSYTINKMMVKKCESFIPPTENIPDKTKSNDVSFMISKDGKNHSPPTLNCKWVEEDFCHIVTVVFQKTLDSPLVATLKKKGSLMFFQWWLCMIRTLLTFLLPSVTSNFSSYLEVVTFTNNHMGMQSISWSQSCHMNLNILKKA